MVLLLWEDVVCGMGRIHNFGDITIHGGDMVNKKKVMLPHDRVMNKSDVIHIRVFADITHVDAMRNVDRKTQSEH